MQRVKILFQQEQEDVTQASSFPSCQLQNLPVHRIISQPKRKSPCRIRVFPFETLTLYSVVVASRSKARINPETKKKKKRVENFSSTLRSAVPDFPLKRGIRVLELHNARARVRDRTLTLEPATKPFPR